MGKTRKRFDKDSFADYNYVSGDDFQDQNSKRNNKRFYRAIKQGNIDELLALNNEIDNYDEDIERT